MALSLSLAMLLAPASLAHAQQLGADCTATGACSSGLECRDLGPGFGLSGDERFCTRGCATDGDCSASTVCMVMRDTPGAGRCTPRGSAALGAFCTRNPDCSTGLCVAETCREPCATDCDCSTGTRCVSLDRADSVPGACRSGASSCTMCGDGVVGEREECDDGAANSDSAPDRCRTSCLRAHCGDSVVDSGEECDDGNRIDRDGCSSRCARDSAPPIDQACLPYESTCTGDVLGRTICEGSRGYLRCPEQPADAGAGTFAQECVCRSGGGWLCSSTPECRLLSSDTHLERPVERPVGCSISRGHRAGATTSALASWLVALALAMRLRRASRRR